MNSLALHLLFTHLAAAYLDGFIYLTGAFVELHVRVHGSGKSSSRLSAFHLRSDRPTVKSRPRASQVVLVCRAVARKWPYVSECEWFRGRNLVVLIMVMDKFDVLQLDAHRSIGFVYSKTNSKSVEK